MKGHGLNTGVLLISCFSISWCESGSGSLPSLGSPLALHENAVKSALFPTWGALESKSYVASTLEFLVDALGWSFIISEALSPINDVGAGVPTLTGLGLLACNRMVALPVNMGLAARHNRRISRANDGAALPPAAISGPHALGFFAHGPGYANSVTGGAGLFSHVGKTRFQFAWNYEGDRVGNMQENGHIALGMNRDFAMTKSLLVSPGCLWAWVGYRQESGGGEVFLTSFHQKLVPNLALVFLPHSRVRLEAGLGYSYYVDTLRETFGISKGGGFEVPEPENPLRLNFSVGLWVL